jgi:hypothetical protein
LTAMSFSSMPSLFSRSLFDITSPFVAARGCDADFYLRRCRLELWITLFSKQIQQIRT